MRSLFAVIALILGTLSIVLTARYGFKGADNEVDGAIAAAMFGAIALCAFLLDVGAVRLWFIGLHKAAVFIGLIASAAFVVTFVNSFGGIASRDETVLAERVKSADRGAHDRARLERISNDIAAVPDYMPTSAAAVDATKQAARVATANREAECSPKRGGRGPKCGDRELDEQAAAKAVAAAEVNKAATDRTLKLEAEAATIRKRLSTTTLVVSADPLADAIGRLLRIPAAEARTWPQAIVAGVFELCLVACIVMVELLRHEKPVRSVPRAVQATRTRDLELAPNVVELIPNQRALPKPSTEEAEPDEEVDPSSVIRFMKERVPKSAGEEAGWADIYYALPEWWERHGVEGDPPTPAQLGAILGFIADETGMPTRKRAGKVYFIGRKVV